MKKDKKHLFGIGIDMERIERFKGLNRKKDSAFLKKIFTQKELAYCLSRKEPAQHFAVRFSGKEACIKALGSLGIHNVVLRDIEIARHSPGTPSIVFRSNRLKKEKLEVSVSLSHAGPMAVATVIAARTT